MSSSNEVDVAVIGAGAAGLAAAAAARAAGLSVTVLEAKNRIGGRAHTVADALPGGPFDLGCHWMHDASENPFGAVAIAHGIAFRNSRHPARLPHWLSLAGRTADAAERTACADYYEACYAAFHDAGAAGRDIPGIETLDTSSPYYPLFRGWCAAILGVPPEWVSTADYHAQIDTGENWPAPTGYGALIAETFRHVPVALGRRVQAVDRRGPRLAVTTDDGTLAADDVIVAVSTSVLAAERIAFTPALPDDVREAVAAVPLGHAERVGVALAHKIDGLPDHCAGHMLTAAGEEIGLMIHEFGRAEVTAYLAGGLAAGLGQEGPEAAIAFVREALREAFGADVAASITAAVASAWSGDPDVLGAYSHALPGAAHRRARLAQPVDERLHLAGEATHPTRFASAHGAYMSGIRAVTDVLTRRQAAGA